LDLILWDFEVSMHIIKDVASDVTKPGIRRRGEVTGVVRRRRWRVEQKGQIVAEAIAPGAVVVEVARRHDLAPGQLWGWIRAAKHGDFALPGDETAFVPVVAGDTAVVPAVTVSAIEIIIGAMMVRIPAKVDAQTLETVLRAVKRT
jgi:transposase